MAWKGGGKKYMTCTDPVGNTPLNISENKKERKSDRSHAVQTTIPGQTGHLKMIEYWQWSCTGCVHNTQLSHMRKLLFFNVMSLYYDDVALWVVLLARLANYICSTSCSQDNFINSAAAEPIHKWASTTISHHPHPLFSSCLQQDGLFTLQLWAPDPPLWALWCLYHVIPLSSLLHFRDSGRGGGRWRGWWLRGWGVGVGVVVSPDRKSWISSAQISLPLHARAWPMSHRRQSNSF